MFTSRRSQVIYNIRVRVYNNTTTPQSINKHSNLLVKKGVFSTFCLAAMLLANLCNLRMGRYLLTIWRPAYRFLSAFFAKRSLSQIWDFNNMSHSASVANKFVSAILGRSRRLRTNFTRDRV